MSSTITGLGSGFDINSWVEQLVAAKESTMLTPLQTKLTNLQNKKPRTAELRAEI